jgi:hypothetical protein
VIADQTSKYRIQVSATDPKKFEKDAFKHIFGEFEVFPEGLEP